MFSHCESIIILDTSTSNKILPLFYKLLPSNAVLSLDNSVTLTENLINCLVRAALRVNDLRLAIELRSQNVLFPFSPIDGKYFKHLLIYLAGIISP